MIEKRLLRPERRRRIPESFSWLDHRLIRDRRLVSCEPPALALYLLGQFALGFHLWHGFASGFQSIGLRHARYTPLLQGLGKAFSVVVPALFALIVVYLYVSQS